MFRPSLRRSTRNRIIRASLLILCIYLLIDLLSFSLTRSYAPPPTLYRSNASKSPEKIFIASIHWNNEAVIRTNWTFSLLSLCKERGPKNVFISLYESGSWDDTKGALRELDEQLEKLGVDRQVILSDRTHKDELEAPMGDGWIETSRGRKELRRVPYLADLRNKAMAPLGQMSKADRRRFGKILWINDVVFTVEDVLILLGARGGEYAAVCSMDYSKPPAYYDTFALRDNNGHEAASSTFPYFRSEASRDAILRGHPVPVQSCWNGMIAFDAEPFISVDSLKFRGVRDSLATFHLEGSECCLVHYDNPLSSQKGVWLIPNVRVGYSSEAYNGVHSSTGIWPSLAQAYRGMWWNRLTRWLTTDHFKSRVVHNRVDGWKRSSEARFETGIGCLINEMQVLVENGWAHV